MIAKNINRLCKDYTKIENYDKAISDVTQTWICHHRLECVETGAVVNSSVRDLIDWGIYYNRPADELIFLKRGDHQALHNRNHTVEQSEKLSKAGKLRRTSEETKQKISKSKKGKKLSDEHRRRISEGHIGVSSGMKGKTPWNKGKAGGTAGKSWFNNGVTSVLRFECPEGFVPGRLKRGK